MYRAVIFADLLPNDVLVDSEDEYDEYWIKEADTPEKAIELIIQEIDPHSATLKNFKHENGIIKVGAALWVVGTICNTTMHLIPVRK